MKAIILLGAPGAGKGTAAEGIKAALPYIHIATGDMLREALKKGSPLGKEAESYIKRGELVPDSIIIKMVDDRLDQGAPGDAYMFDGFPRNLAQSRLLEDSFARRGGTIERVFFLDASREVLVSRLTGRRTCRKCGRNFHVVNIPPRKEGVCDACGGALYQRPDDQEDTIVRRLEVFRRETESLISHYETMGILTRVDSSVPHQQITSAIVGMLTRA